LKDRRFTGWVVHICWGSFWRKIDFPCVSHENGGAQLKERRFWERGLHN